MAAKNHLGPMLSRRVVKAVPQTRYAKSGDVNIAYQIVGEGPVDLVYVPGWVSHVEEVWEEPTRARFLSRLASFSRLLLFDKRGTGMSDRVPLGELPTLEQRMDDVRAVMDAAGVERAALFGFSEGGNMSILFAATYPQRTIALVTFGVFAKRLRSPDYPWAPTWEDRQKEIALVEREWGGDMDLSSLAPSVAHDEGFRRMLATYLRRSASPGAAAALLRMNTFIDVRHVLPTIRVPTLVLHRTHDRDASIEEGRYIAARIPGAKFVELPGQDHLPWVGGAGPGAGNPRRAAHWRGRGHGRQSGRHRRAHRGARGRPGGTRRGPSLQHRPGPRFRVRDCLPGSGRTRTEGRPRDLASLRRRRAGRPHPTPGIARALRCATSRRFFWHTEWQDERAAP